MTIANARMLAVLAALTLVAGCGSNGRSESPWATTSPGRPTTAEAGKPKASRTTTKPPRRSPQAVYEAKVLSLAREFSRCARAHGKSDFPDPVMTNGEPEWPGVDKTVLVQVGETCQTMLGRWPENPKLTAPPTPEIRKRMRQLAQCMRDHGVSDFPDPNADGTFSLKGTRLSRDVEPRGQVAQAWGDCRQYLNGWIVRER